MVNAIVFSDWCFARLSYCSFHRQPKCPSRALAHSSAFHGRTKHIEVHYHFVRELVNSQVINLAYCQVLKKMWLIYLLSPFQGKPLISSSIDSMLDRRSGAERRCWRVTTLFHLYYLSFTLSLFLNSSLSRTYNLLNAFSL